MSEKSLKDKTVKGVDCDDIDILCRYVRNYNDGFK